MSGPSEIWELLLRLVCAAIAGAAIGFERSVARRPAGLRTHALVAVGAATFTLAGAYGFRDLDAPNSDPARVAAQVVSGLGFIGAGAIIRNGFEVSGLTTASTVWAAGALGLAFASGNYTLGVSALVVTVVVLVAMRPLRSVSSRLGRQDVTVQFYYHLGHGTLAPVLDALDDVETLTINGVSVDDGKMDLDDDGLTTRTVRRLTISGSIPKTDVDNIAPTISQITQREEVLKAVLTTD